MALRQIKILKRTFALAKALFFAIWQRKEPPGLFARMSGGPGQRGSVPARPQEEKFGPGRGKKARQAKWQKESCGRARKNSGPGETPDSQPQQNPTTLYATASSLFNPATFRPFYKICKNALKKMHIFEPIFRLKLKNLIFELNFKANFRPGFRLNLKRKRNERKKEAIFSAIFKKLKNERK